MKKILFALTARLLLGACQEKMEDRAERDARETTAKRCPMRLTDDGSIILERITFDKLSHTWKQDYLIAVDSTAAVSITEMRKLLLQELKNAPSYKPYMDNRFNFRYVYCRMENPKDTVCDITLKEKDYR